jgi:hypothetical protein
VEPPPGYGGRDDKSDPHQDKEFTA